MSRLHVSNINRLQPVLLSLFSGTKRVIWNMMSIYTGRHEEFIDQLARMSQSEAIFLLTTFANIATSRDGKEREFIEAITSQIYKVWMTVWFLEVTQALTFCFVTLGWIHSLLEKRLSWKYYFDVQSFHENAPYFFKSCLLYSRRFLLLPVRRESHVRKQENIFLEPSLVITRL